MAKENPNKVELHIVGAIAVSGIAFVAYKFPWAVFFTSAALVGIIMAREFNSRS